MPLTPTSGNGGWGERLKIVYMSFNCSFNFKSGSGKLACWTPTSHFSVCLQKHISWHQEKAFAFPLPSPCQYSILLEMQSKISLEKFWSMGNIQLQQEQGDGPGSEAESGLKTKTTTKITATMVTLTEKRWEFDFQIWNIKSRVCHTLHYSDHWLSVVRKREAHSSQLCGLSSQINTILNGKSSH